MKPVIYQLVVRYFGNTCLANRTNGSIQVNGCGKFNDINRAALRGLVELGVTHIWLTGVLRQATLTDNSDYGLPADNPNIVKGIAGSFYAVRDYYDVCPDYAENIQNRMLEFEQLIERIHHAGLQVLIDLVPNHVSRAYHSERKYERSLGSLDDTSQFFTPQNEFFYLVEPPKQRLQLPKPEFWNPPGVVFDGNFVAEDGNGDRVPKATGNNVTTPCPEATDWYETVKLNYGYNFVSGSGEYTPRPRLWESMDAILAFWQNKGVDGFRCDFAHYVPAEAWQFLIARARERKPAYFLAEAYPWKGSGDPVESQDQLIEAGFDAVYYYQSYNALKDVYRVGNVQGYVGELLSKPDWIRSHLATYLENHDERRLASSISHERSAGESGFGCADAGYQLAPLQYLYSDGPILLLNGQEVGEEGEGLAGFGGNDGRTTIYDYWTMPAFAKWVNGHLYDGGELNDRQRALRHYYSALLKLCQDPSIVFSGFWELGYFNHRSKFADSPENICSFSRFRPGSASLLLVVANFFPGGAARGKIRLPWKLCTAAGLTGEMKISLILSRNGSEQLPIASASAEDLGVRGFEVHIPNQTCYVYRIES